MEGAGHERKHMFNVTSPFTDVEGLRFTSITNSPYDFLDYNPTPEHVFLTNPSLQAFGKYVDELFPANDQQDWTYFKILRKLCPEDFENLSNIIENSRQSRRSIQVGRSTTPICLIPVAEFVTLEEYSRVYRVKANNISLEKTQIRLKLNTYFKALLRVLNCQESDIIDILYMKQVIPSRNFHLLCTQKELTYALKKIHKSGTLARLGDRLRRMEINARIILKPFYGSIHSNLCQSLEYLFGIHPLFSKFQNSLTIETQLNGDGKGILANAMPNRKRKINENSRDLSKLPKRWRKNAIETQAEPSFEQYAENISSPATHTPRDPLRPISVNNASPHTENSPKMQQKTEHDEAWLEDIFDKPSDHTEISSNIQTNTEPADTWVEDIFDKPSDPTEISSHTEISSNMQPKTEPGDARLQEVKFEKPNDHNSQINGDLNPEEGEWYMYLFDKQDILAMALQMSWPEALQSPPTWILN